MALPFLFVDKVTATPSDLAPIRIGFFPNISHAQALISQASGDIQNDFYTSSLGRRVEWRMFNAGPSAIESLFSGDLDFAYVGPSPAINGFVRSLGKEVRIIAGSASGGSALVLRGDLVINSPADFIKLKIATPQFGNTQDIAARSWFKEKGLQITISGGDLFIIPTSNGELFSLFSQKFLDGAWTSEPWVSLLQARMQGKIYYRDDEDIATVLVASGKMLKNPVLLESMLTAHRKSSDWLSLNPDLARVLVHDQIKTLIKIDLDKNMLEQAWSHLVFDTKINQDRLAKLVSDATELGFIRHPVNISQLINIDKS